MHPVIQLTVAVLMMVVAARMWPPILYIAVSVTAVIMTVKCARRSLRWFNRHCSRDDRLTGIAYTASVIISYVIAGVVDCLMDPKLSAITMVNCFAGAIGGTVVLAWMIEKAIRLLQFK